MQVPSVFAQAASASTQADTASKAQTSQQDARPLSFFEQIQYAFEALRARRPAQPAPEPEPAKASPLETKAAKTEQPQPVSVTSIENIRRELEANGISASDVTLKYDEINVWSPFGNWVNRGVTVECANGRTLRFDADAAASNAWAIGQVTASMLDGRSSIGLPPEEIVS